MEGSAAHFLPPAAQAMMDDKPKHECGFALLRLLKPLSYFEERYGPNYAISRMYLMMEKQRNRGQDGCGLACVKLDIPPGTRYLNCEKSIAADPIKDVFERVNKMRHHKMQNVPAQAYLQGGTTVDPTWIKENLPFQGEMFLGHVRYGTDSDNSVDRCHPVLRESNWQTRSLLLAGNFNITNNEDLFASLVDIGQHPRELSDTVQLLEKVGHFVDQENNNLYVKYSAKGQAPRTCFRKIAKNLDIAKVLRRASADWDGGYCIAGLLGHGDSFVMRDPNGIRPAFYLANDEVVVVASEAPLIQTVFEVDEAHVHPLPPGQALVVKCSGEWSLEHVLPAQPLMQCSFERIYFSRGNDMNVYRERERLGRLLLRPLMKLLEAKNDSFENTVLSYIPNTSELAFMGLVKEAQDELMRQRSKALAQFMQERGGAGDISEFMNSALASTRVRTEKVIHKDAKVRTFIQEDSTRENLTVHAYDVHYGTIQPGKDVCVALDDSIVRGNTLRNAILRTIDKLKPKRILILSSSPQLRYPDPYGIDMAKLGDLCAFKAAITLLEERGLGHLIDEVYYACRAQLTKPLKSGKFVNHVQRIYERFTDEEICAKITEQIRPDDCRSDVDILFNSVDALHQAMPEHAGDWYFTGNYPTPGGTKVCCRAFVLWRDGSNARCYGVSSANLHAQAPVLIVGDGGSERTLAWKLSESRKVSCVYVASSSGGVVPSSGHFENKKGCGHKYIAPVVATDVPVRPPLFQEVKEFCKERRVSLIIVGSRAMIAEGLVDVLRADSLPVLGPTQAAGEIDSSPAFAGAFAQRHSVPLLRRDTTGDQGGEPPYSSSISVLAISDGSDFAVLPAGVQEHRASASQEGALVGAGAFAPSPLLDQETLTRVQQHILRPVFDGLRAEGRPYVGCLHADIAIMPDGPVVSGFRCQFGELAAQTTLPLLSDDLFDVFSACIEPGVSGLNQHSLHVQPDAHVVAVAMLAPAGGSAGGRKHIVSGLDVANCMPGAHVFHAATRLETCKNAVLPKTPNYSSAQQLTVDGDHVLTIAAVGHHLSEARERAYACAKAIHFTHVWYSDDVALIDTVTTPKFEASPSSPSTYLKAGVCLGAQLAVKKRFQPLARRTYTKRLDIEGRPDLVGAFALPSDEDKFMFTKTCIVGTKLTLAQNLKDYTSLGVDLVAMCVNDIVTRGVEPLIFQHQLSTDVLNVSHSIEFVKGISDGCIEAGCALMDACVAELPGVFRKGCSNVAGFCMGVARTGEVLPKTESLAAGDVLVALPASGLHSDGFSLVRLVINTAGFKYEDAAPFDPTQSLAEALLTPTRIYVKPTAALAREGLLRGAVHVATGGLNQGLGELLPTHLGAHLRAETWELPAVMRWLGVVGKIENTEMAATFNCGLGMIFVVAPENVDRVKKILKEHREEPIVVGEITARAPGAAVVEIEGSASAWSMLPEFALSLPFPAVESSQQDATSISRARTLVLAGPGKSSPLRGLMQDIQLHASAAMLVAVLSPYADSPALGCAKEAGVQAIPIGGGPGSKIDSDSITPDMATAFSANLRSTMESMQAELVVCLGDFDPSLLTGELLADFAGKVILVHQSLLPAFPGKQPVEDAVQARVCITGCTVLFPVPPAGQDAPRPQGPQILQEVLHVLPSDTVGSLQERLVSKCELPAVSKAVQLVATGSVALKRNGADYGVVFKAPHPAHCVREAPTKTEDASASP